MIIKRLIDKLRKITLQMKYGEGFCIGSNTNVKKKNIFFSKPSMLRFGNDVFCREGCLFSTIKDASLDVKDNVFFNRNCSVYAHKKIEIGENTIFGPNVCIFDHDHRFNKNGAVRSEFNCNEIIIGKNCWIGANVIILKGVILGDGCIVGAGTILTKGEYKAHSLIKSSRDLMLEDLK